MTYLLLGEDGQKKEARIADLKKKVIASEEAEKFDCEILHGNKLDPQHLKKSLLALPAIAPRRLILVRDCHKLSPHNKELIAEFISLAHSAVDGAGAKQDYLVLVLESGQLTERDSFVKKIKPFAKIQQCGIVANEKSVFDMTNAMTRRGRQAEALMILSELLSRGEHPLKIMGGLVWFWGKRRQGLAYEKFEQGLAALKEADLNIKRSRLRPEFALEMLVVKLCGILG